jgi:predicted ATP-grasp superfamily ATP-dependent carboligase
VSRILVTGARAPVALDLARSFRSAGCDVRLADSVRPFAASLSRPRFEILRLPPPRRAFAEFRARLSDLAGRFDLIVPTCEEVFWLAAAAERDGWSERLYAPSTAALRRLHSKASFPGLAREAGVEAPATWTIASAADLEHVPLASSDLVLKPEFSRFGARTMVGPAPGAAAALQASERKRWVAQERLAGEEYCVWSALRSGRLVACIVYRPALRHGRSAAYAFEAVDSPPIVEMARRIAAKVGGDGQLSYDVIVGSDGRIAPIECNPRAVSAIHLADGSPALARAILGRSELVPPRAGTVRYLSPAMVLMGLPAAVAGGSLAPLRAVWSAGRDSVGRPGDRLPVAGVLLDAARFALVGLARLRSPTRETTDDIEWNGEDFE